MKTSHTNRRKFLKKLLSGAAALGLYPYIGHSGNIGFASVSNKIPTRPLGKTGYQTGIYSLGGQATLERIERRDQAIEIINRAIDLGINYIDTAASYVQPRREEDFGTSERYIGEVMKTRRSEVFLATKTHKRTYDEAMRLLDSSLKNLQTDYLDTWQLHSIRPNEDIDRLFSEDGVVKALQKAKEEGIVRNIGITGHYIPSKMKEILERENFDTILMALNAADKHYDSFIDNLLPTAVEQEMGIIGMKVPSRDRVLKDGLLTMKEAMYYVLSLPVSTIIVGIDKIEELEENIRLAKQFQPLTVDELIEIEEKTKPHYKSILFYRGLSDKPMDYADL